MASFFDFVKAPELKKYKYDLSNEVKFSGRVGDLIPFSWDFLSPGDSVTKNSYQFLRTAPMMHPIFQKMNVDVHHFFVPLRLIWDDFESFITGFNQKNAQPLEINHPKFLLKGSNLAPSLGFDWYDKGMFFGTSSLSDYLGIPVQELPDVFTSSKGGVQDVTIEISQLPFRAYAKVFNDYYRDSIKEPELTIPTDSNDLQVFATSDPEDGIILDSLLTLRRRALGKDYFTSSQPTPQLGSDVNIPVGGSASGQVEVTMANKGFPSPTNVQVGQTSELQAGGALVKLLGTVKSSGSSSSFESFTINKLRELFSIQKWRDAGNRFGSRYKEQTLGHFGVETPDARLQRPQFLGGGRIPLMINQVSQLSQGTEDSPLGYQAGQGMASGSDNYISFDAKEHGILISFISVLPENSYFRGIPKKFKLFDRFDFPFPEFATLGEQPVLSSEMNVNFEDDFTYGYQERYADFKTNYNTVAGEFRSSLRNFFMASPQVSGSCNNEDNIRPASLFYDNVFVVDSEEADNVYFLVQNEFTKYSPLPYLDRVQNDYV